MNLTDEQIDKVEEFGRNEILDLFKNKCTLNNGQFDCNESKHFVGMYASNSKEFKILMGDRKLLKAATRDLNQIQESRNFEEFISYFTMPENYKIGKGNTDILSVGLFFGQKLRSSKPKISLTENDMATEVFAKIKPLFQQFVKKSLISVRDITEDVVKIVKFETGIRADIVCVFCPSNDPLDGVLQKTIAVQYEKTRNSTSRCWNISNLKRHLNRHLKNPAVSEKENIPDDSFLAGTITEQ